MPRRLLASCSIGSLALFTASAGAWTWAERSDGPSCHCLPTPWGRALVRFDRTVVEAIGPPASGGGDTAVRERVARMRNADLLIECRSSTLPWAEGELYSGGPRPGDGTATAEAAAAFGRPGGAPAVVAHRAALVETLDDPDRFAAAHVLLTDDWSGGGGRRRQPDAYTASTAYPVRAAVTGGGFTLDVDGLRVDLPPPSHRGGVDVRYVGPPGIPIWTYRLDGPTSARVDPAQRAALRDRWLAALGRPLLRIPYWLAAAATAALPLLWALRRAGDAVRLRGRRAAGRCTQCGYDLRGSPSRCPECGRAPA